MWLKLNAKARNSVHAQVMLKHMFLFGWFRWTREKYCWGIAADRMTIDEHWILNTSPTSKYISRLTPIDAAFVTLADKDIHSIWLDLETTSETVHQENDRLRVSSLPDYGVLQLLLVYRMQYLMWRFYIIQYHIEHRLMCHIYIAISYRRNYCIFVSYKGIEGNRKHAVKYLEQRKKSGTIVSRHSCGNTLSAQER